MAPPAPGDAQRQRAIRILLVSAGIFVLLAVALLSALAWLGPLIWSRHLDVKLDGDVILEREQPPLDHDVLEDDAP